HPLVPIAIALWALQLALNVIWTPVFSGAQNLEGALYYIIALWVSILAYIAISWRVDRWISYLMVPYFLWVSFATVLNYTYWQANM
ncbi:MAG: tryptophan-rich sensory protein, partial [Gammaproteobacteria bacterium]|nr:tryptophan-rich sensory protein [Gammaproteobacteria bacterium]